MPVLLLHPDGSIGPAPGGALSAEDPGFLRGESVFETLTVGARGPVLLDAHLDRLEAGTAAMGLAVPGGRAGLAALAAAAPRPSMLRLVVTAGGTALAVVGDLPDHRAARTTGITAVTLDLGLAAGARAERPWLLGGVKTTSYAVAMSGLREARRRGADEAVWTSTDGEVLEATTANVAWVGAGVLHTVPAAETGILAGTTVAWALSVTDAPVVVARARVEELAGADEVMVTSSVRGVAPVVSLDGRPVGDGRRGPVTAALVAAWERLVDGG